MSTYETPPDIYGGMWAVLDTELVHMTGGIPGHVVRDEIIAVDLLDDMPERPHRRWAEVEDLVDDISVNGILSAVHVIPAGGGRYVIADGHMRVQAARHLGIGSIRCAVHEIGPAWAPALWTVISRWAVISRHYEDSTRS